MKTLRHFILLILVLTSCTNGPAPSVTNDSSSLSSGKSEVMPDTAKISIVKAFTAGRTVTVGGPSSEITGFTSAAIQTACDAVHLAGGGKVVLKPGTYDIEAPVRIYDNTTISGSGTATVLRKCKGFRSAFALDADYGELKITVKDPSGFRTGMGVAIFDDEHRSGWDVTTARITAIKNNDIYIDSWLLRDYNSAKGGTLTNACSVIEAIEARNVCISDLAIEGGRETNDLIDGCRQGAIYLHKVKNALVENVKVSNFNCDGISWQITENVTVRNCEVTGCANAGLHPGTGSPYTIIENNKSHNNGGYGLFVCWRVRNGIVKDNIFYANGINGICTGHKDVDMLYTGNYIYNNAGDGINLRGETPLNAPHRSIFRKNIIENNGTKSGGYGFSVNSQASGILLEDNIFRSAGKGNQLAAVMLMKNSLPVEMKNNRIDAHPKGEILKE